MCNVHICKLHVQQTTNENRWRKERMKIQRKRREKHFLLHFSCIHLGFFSLSCDNSFGLEIFAAGWQTAHSFHCTAFNFNSAWEEWPKTKLWWKQLNGDRRKKFSFHVSEIQVQRTRRV